MPRTEFRRQIKLSRPASRNRALAKLVLILASWLLNRHYGLAWVLGENCCRLRGLAEAAGPFVLLHCRRGPVLARRVVARRCNNSVAFGAKRTFSQPR